MFGAANSWLAGVAVCAALASAIGAIWPLAAIASSLACGTVLRTMPLHIPTPPSAVGGAVARGRGALFTGRFLTAGCAVAVFFGTPSSKKPFAILKNIWNAYL